MTAPAPAAVLDLANLREAQAALAGVARRTPLIESAALGRLVGAPVFLKAEQLQPIGAFKIRGAYTSIRRLPEETRARGVVTHSSGNHAQAVAWVARHFSVPAVIVMPADAPRVKREAVVAMGAELVTVADRSEREPTAARIARERGIVMIPPFESLDVIAGQGTTGLEILEQLPEVAEVLVPVGGGGLLAGIALALSLLRPGAEAIGVEPVSAAKLALALSAGAPTRLPAAPRSIADGLLPPAFGQLPWSIVSGRVRRAVQVEDSDIARAVRFLYESHGLRVEPSGAATVAALLAGRVRPRGPAVAVLSGGNLDPELFASLTGEA